MVERKDGLGYTADIHPTYLSDRDDANGGGGSVTANPTISVKEGIGQGGVCEKLQPLVKGFRYHVMDHPGPRWSWVRRTTMDYSGPL